MKYTIYKGRKYKLIGECKQCGKCCIGNICYLTNFETNLVESIELQNPNFDMSIQYCKTLDTKTMLCKKHEEKSSLCKDYPRLFMELYLFPDCGYKWELVETVSKTDELDTTLKLTESDKEFKEVKNG